MIPCNRSMRPFSECDKKVDVHVLVVPTSHWRASLRVAHTSTCFKSTSAGFVRVFPDITLSALKTEVSKQLDCHLLPTPYTFLRNIGHSLTWVSQKQESTLKVRLFLPPLAPCPEIYVLDSACLRDVPSKSVKNAKSQRSLAVSASPSNIMPKHYTGCLASQLCTHQPPYSGGHTFCHCHHPPVHLDYPLTHQEVYDCEHSLARSCPMPSEQQHVNGMYSHRLSNCAANSSSKNYDEQESPSPHIDKSSYSSSNVVSNGHYAQHKISNTKRLSQLPRGSQFRSRNMTKTFPGGLSERQAANPSSLLTSNIHSPSLLNPSSSLSTYPTAYSNTVQETSSKIDRDGLFDHYRNSQPTVSNRSPKTKKMQETDSKLPQVVGYRSVHINRSDSLQRQARLIQESYTDTDSNTTTRCNSSENYYLTSSEDTGSSVCTSNSQTPVRQAQSDPENSFNAKNHDKMDRHSLSFRLVNATHNQPITTGRYNSDEDSERSSEDDEQINYYHTEQLTGNSPKECVANDDNSVVKVDTDSGQSFNKASGPTSVNDVPHNVRFSNGGRLNEPNLFKQRRVRLQSESQATTLNNKGPEYKRSKTFPLNGPRALPAGVRTGFKKPLTVKETNVTNSRQIFTKRDKINKPEKNTTKAKPDISNSTKPAHGTAKSTKPTHSTAKSTKPAYGIPNSTKPAHGGSNTFAAADPLPPIMPIGEHQDDVQLKNKTEKEKNIEPTKNRSSTAETNHLLGEIRIRKQECAQLSSTKAELSSTLRSVQMNIRTQREDAGNEWKRKYFQEKKMTTVLEEKIKKVKNDCQVLQSELDRKLLKGSIKLAVNSDPPSESANVKIQCKRLEHDIQQLKSRLETVKQQMSAERKRDDLFSELYFVPASQKARKASMSECKTLREELLRKKIAHSQGRNKQIAANS